MEMLDRAAVGRVAKLGDQYNARTDQFLGKSCFKHGSIIPNQPTDVPDTQMKIVSSNSSFNEMFASLNVSGDVCLSILTGLVKPRGAANFILESCRDKNVSWAALAHTISKVKEELDLSSNDLLDVLDLESLVPEATHILAGITWGGSAVLIAEYPSQDHHDNIENGLDLLDMVGRVENTLKGGTADSLNVPKELVFTVYSDLNTEVKETCRNLNAAITLMKRLPSNIQNNRGKAVAVSFHFLEVSVILDSLGMRETIDRTARFLDDDLVDRSVTIFHEFGVAKSKMDALIHSIGERRYLPLTHKDSDELFAAQAKLDQEERSFKEYLKDFLIQYRSLKDDQAIVDHIDQGYRYVEALKEDLLDRLEKLTTNDFVCFVNTMTKNVKFVDGIRKLQDILRRSEETYVLFASAKFVVDNVKSWKESKGLFSSLVSDMSGKKKGKSRSEGIEFVIVNCEVPADAMKKFNVQQGAIQKYQKGKYVETLNSNDETNSESSETEYGTASEKDEDSDENLEPELDVQDVCVAVSPTIRKDGRIATGLVQLRIPCPRHRKNCSKDVQTWMCPLCHADIMYDFRDNFHCGCGFAESHTYKFKCTHKKHGDDFASFPVASLYDNLRKLEPPKEINILILGETGVGKSTWINAFQNYVLYPNLQEALKAKDVCYLIPAKFTVTNDDFDERTVSIGHDSNEEGKTGSSATKGPRSYVFRRGDFLIRLIDTPGIGDTAGIEQDRKNFEQILTYLSQYDKIHGICILLKPNNARLTVMFRFCVKELLTHLHKDAVRNIVFCFTNTSGTDYRPGDTYPALKKLLEENENVHFRLGTETVFCMDNEAFRFLLARGHGVKFSKMEEDNARSSWNHSAGEIDRMISIIVKKEPHLTKNTLSLNHARATIVKLTRPLAEIARNIHNNVDALNDYQSLLKDSDQNLMELAKRVHMPQVDIICEPLPHPRTVCTGSECTTIVYCGGIRKIDYITHCHDHCYLKGVPTEKVGTEALQECEAIHPDTMECVECGCEWNIHMHITYDTQEKKVQVEDRQVVTQIRTEEEAKRVIQQRITMLDERKNALIKEHEHITRVCAQFGSFLKVNAITTYNDSLGEYLEHLIRQEREKVVITKDYKALEGLKKTLNSYQQEVALLNDATQHGILHHLEPEEIHHLVEGLYHLPLNGQKLQNIVGVADEAHDRFAREQEALMQNPLIITKPTGNRNARNPTNQKKGKKNKPNWKP